MREIELTLTVKLKQMTPDDREDWGYELENGSIELQGQLEAVEPETLAGAISEHFKEYLEQYGYREIMGDDGLWAGINSITASDSRDEIIRKDQS